ncbi:hypothetical protein [Luteolibacter marinus]|uniref:hypothetical protein n=1 Tax=Luteolibacter marinus TaxID=2776705 RepID=UPI0018666C6C|nr:hypothetical protein [Luteolibacter marinus]
MTRSFFGVAIIAGCLAGCGKKESSGSAEVPAVEEAQAVLPAVATHLGFATRVPADADLFVAGYGAADWLNGLSDTLETIGIIERQTIVLGDPDAEAPEPLEDAEEPAGDLLADMAGYVGDEWFVFVGPGTAGQLQMVGASYRELSAAWGGFAIGQMLDMAADKEFDLSELEDGLSGDLLDRWVSVLEKDSQLRVPAVVMGWRPDAAKLEECRDTLVKGIRSDSGETSEIREVNFEACGCELAGIEIAGSDVFEEFLTKIRAEIAAQGAGAEALEMISPEQMERLLTALENVKFTVAAGTVDGRVVLYLGNGAEGFQLAGTPEASLAATPDLTWTSDFDKDPGTVIYLSEPMVRAALPWLDTSDYWDALSAAVRPPVREQRVFRDLLSGIASTGRELARRDASAWSAVFMQDDGWRLESRGGWPNPDLDYETPLKMTDAASSQEPAIRAHWVQKRDRKDLGWRQVEQFGLLADATYEEIKANAGEVTAMIPEGVVPRLMEEVRGFNRTYREEFRAGVGDEIAVVVDFKGEMPPVPGLSEETLKDAKVPRFIVARPVTDRAKLDAAGTSLAERWKGLTAWASELSGEELPLILPQSVESNGLVTWYPPLPFIGGDFLPGVTLNDELWMLGTSRSMAGGFSKSMAAASEGGETGMIVEIDFEPVRQWLRDLYQRNEAEAEGLAGDAPDAVKGLASEENREKLAQAADRLKGLSYRQWLADGTPRTSLRVHVEAAE